MNMVQCSKVVTGHRYGIGLLKGCNCLSQNIIGISFMLLNNKHRFSQIAVFSLTTFLH